MKPFYTPIYTAAAMFGVVAVLPSSSPVQAGTIYNYATPSGATNGQESVSASVTVDIGDDLIQVKLTDTSTAIHDMGQVLTGVTISLTGSPTGTNVASGLAGSSADVVVVNSQGVIHDYGSNPIFGKNITIAGLSDQTTPPTTYNGWTISNTASSPDLSVFGTGGPNFGVLDGMQTTYLNTGTGSISGNTPHNPFSFGTAIFNVGYTNKSVSSSTAVTKVVFQFGTSSTGGFVTGNLVVPEPTSLALWSAALVTMGYRRLRTRTIKSNEKAISP